MLQIGSEIKNNGTRELWDRRWPCDSSSLKMAEIKFQRLPCPNSTPTSSPLLDNQRRFDTANSKQPSTVSYFLRSCPRPQEVGCDVVRVSKVLDKVERVLSVRLELGSAKKSIVSQARLDSSSARSKKTLSLRSKVTVAPNSTFGQRSNPLRGEKTVGTNTRVCF
jgi:hypothetical protein